MYPARLLNVEHFYGIHFPLPRSKIFVGRQNGIDGQNGQKRRYGSHLKIIFRYLINGIEAKENHLQAYF